MKILIVLVSLLMVALPASAKYQETLDDWDFDSLEHFTPVEHYKHPILHRVGKVVHAVLTGYVVGISTPVYIVNPQ